MNDVISRLLPHIEVVGSHDLAVITHSPDRAYQILDSHYRPEFGANQRIIFYSKYIPSTKLLEHLLSAAQHTNISNCFIMLCCSVDISQTIERVLRSSGFDTDWFDFQLIDIDSLPLEDNFTLPDTFCPVPWINLEVNNYGVVTPCCVSSHCNLGRVEDGIEKIFNGQAMSALRRDFLNGNKPNVCSNCWDKEDKGLTSQRSRQKSFLTNDILISGLDNPTIQHLDLKLGSTCNFKCRICNSSASSLHAAEEAKFKNIPIVVNDWTKNTNNLTQIKNLLPSLTNIDIYGGEPWLLKEFSDILELAVEKDYAKNIRLHYNTNGSVYPTKLIKYWKYFKHVDIHFSIDSIGLRFELERGGSWDQVEDNILKIKSLNLPNCKLNIMPTISIMNVFYLDEVVNWAKIHGLDINPAYVQEPTGYALTQLTAEAKDLLISKYKTSNWSELKQIANAIKLMPDSSGEEFVKLTQHYDNIRNENFSETHSEIAKAMGYVYNKTL